MKAIVRISAYYGGRARACAVYPRRLCVAIVQGLKAQMKKAGMLCEGHVGAVCQEKEMNEKDMAQMISRGEMDVTEHPHYSDEHNAEGEFVDDLTEKDAEQGEGEQGDEE